MADDDDLMFGEMPEDDTVNGLGNDSDADAFNDETFGGPLPSGTNYEELEDYATQTAELRLDDIWDTPGCSKAAPPASDLPMPSFDFTNFGSNPFDFLGTSSSQKMDSIWGENKSDSVWPEHLQTEMVKSLLEEEQSQSKIAPIGSQPVEVSHKSRIPSMPQGPTLEEIEKMHQAAEKPRIPAIPSTAMSAEELEKKILQESRNQQNGQQSVPPSIPSLLGNVPSPVALGMCPPIPPMFVPCFVPWLDVLMGKTQNVPHGCPPPPPFVMALMSRFRNPSVVMGILTQAVTPTGVPPPFLPPMNQQQPSQTQSPHSWQERHRKPPGMPSARTIEDLAFDQFAGYMSIKERQWLVKIQILQCQGTNNPQEDDYYYLNWRHKRIAEGIQAKKDPERSETKDIINGSKQGRKNRERQNSTSEPVDRVTALATRFSGSLGIPTKASTHNPRHSIRVQHGDPTDEEQDKRAAGHQKKLRSLLMRIESATTMLIECNDNKIALETKTMANESRSKLISGNHLMGDLVLNELIKTDFLRILQIQKGRTLFYRYFKVALPQQLLKMMQFLVEQTRTTIAQVKNIAETEDDILSGLFEFSTTLYNHSQIGTIYDNIYLPELLAGLAEKNSFARDYLLTMLAICYVVKNAKTGPLLNWVRSVQPIELSSGFALPDTFIWTILPGFGRENVHNMAQWLRYKVAENSRGTVAEQIAQRLVLY